MPHTIIIIPGRTSQTHNPPLVYLIDDLLSPELMRMLPAREPSVTYSMGAVPSKDSRAYAQHAPCSAAPPAAAAAGHGGRYNRVVRELASPASCAG